MLQTRLQSGFSSMLVSFCSSAAFSAGLRACSGPPENPQNQPQRSFPQDLCGAEGQKPEGEGKQKGGKPRLGRGVMRERRGWREMVRSQRNQVRRKRRNMEQSA